MTDAFSLDGRSADEGFRALDGRATPLGDPARWPPHLKTVADLVLHSTEPMVLVWGPDRIRLHNEAFAPLLGRRQLDMPGQRAEEVWADIGPDIEAAFAGAPLSRSEITIELDRAGRPDEAHFSLAYSPIRSADGLRIDGLLGIATETTDRVAAERRAAATAERQRRLFEQAPGFIMIMRGPEHVVELVNIAHRTAFNSRDWLHRPIREAFPGVVEQGFLEALDDVYRSGRTAEFQAVPVRFRRAPADPEQTRYLSFVYTPLQDEDGAISGVFCEGFDVSALRIATDRHQAMVELADSLRELDDPEELAFTTAEALGRLFGVSRAGYGTINRATETIHIERDWNSPGTESLAGTLHFRDYGSYIEDLKRGVTVVINDADRDPRTAANAQALKDISAHSFINMPVTEEGNFVALLYLNHAEPREWSAEDVAFVRDVADRTRTAVERRRAEAELQQNERRLRFLDALSQRTTISEDADEILAITTRAVAEHLGITHCAYADMDPDEDGFTIRGDWVAPGLSSIIGHYRLSAFGTRAVEALHAGRALVIADHLAELPAEEAQAFHALGIGATICMPLVKDGRLTALMAIHDKAPHPWSDYERRLIREVTERSWAHIERVRSEAGRRTTLSALADLNATLEQQVEERTRELLAAEETLRQAQKMEAVGQLTGGLAHDFNNILTGISGSLELMQMRLAQGRIADIERYLYGALAAAKRAASLTQRLLAFSRRQTLDPKPADLNRVVAGMQELISRTMGPSVELETAAAAGLWSAHVDLGQMENALLNLCINARDAMPEGGKLTIETGNRWLDERGARERGLQPGQYVSLCVSDTGVGMSPDVIARAFDPFFTTKPIGQGTGLGLSMVYGFAAQSNGATRIYSELGKGTMVCLYLPRFVGGATYDQPDEADIVASTGANETVLVVDDEPLVRMVAIDVLQEHGYTVLDAGDGPEALRMLRSDARIDLLLTDVGLPNGMNGRQLADAARGLRPRLKVLFVTGYAENAVLNHGHLGHGMQVLTKPFVGENLVRRVRQLLSETT